MHRFLPLLLTSCASGTIASFFVVSPVAGDLVEGEVPVEIELDLRGTGFAVIRIAEQGAPFEDSTFGELTESGTVPWLPPGRSRAMTAVVNVEAGDESATQTITFDWKAPFAVDLEVCSEIDCVPADDPSAIIEVVGSTTITATPWDSIDAIGSLELLDGDTVLDSTQAPPWTVTFDPGAVEDAVTTFTVAATRDDGAAASRPLALDHSACRFAYEAWAPNQHPHGWGGIGFRNDGTAFVAGFTDALEATIVRALPGELAAPWLTLPGQALDEIAVDDLGNLWTVRRTGSGPNDDDGILYHLDANSSTPVPTSYDPAAVRPRTLTPDGEGGVFYVDGTGSSSRIWHKSDVGPRVEVTTTSLTDPAILTFDGDALFVAGNPTSGNRVLTRIDLDEESQEIGRLTIGTTGGATIVHGAPLGADETLVLHEDGLLYLWNRELTTLLAFVGGENAASAQVAVSTRGTACRVAYGAGPDGLVRLPVPE